MKKMIAVFAALIAAMSGAMAATTPIMPDWMEDIGVGMTVTSGEYATTRGVGQAVFVPETLHSNLHFDATGGVVADVDQTAKTSIQGTQVGMDRQLLTQQASAYAATLPSFTIDAEKDGTYTTMVLGIEKGQSAAVSTMLLGGLAQGLDANGDGTPDDHYQGEHNLIWAVSPSFTGTFSDTGSIAAQGVTLKESLTDAKVTVTTENLNPLAPTYQIDPNSLCVGKGEYWQGYAIPGTPVDYSKQIKVNGPLDTSLGQLTEASAGSSSYVALTQTKTVASGKVTTVNSLDGGASLDAAFENAILDGDNAVALKFNTGTKPFTFWWV
jgi:hypothetical protein